MSNLKGKYYRLPDIQNHKGRWGGGKYHHKLIKEPGLKVWHMQSGKELSLTSQSRNNKPGSAKPKKAMCNCFMSKFILSLLVCFDIGTSQIHVPADACFNAPDTSIHQYVCITLLITFLSYRAKMFHQSVFLLFKCYLKSIKVSSESLRTIDAASPKLWWPVAIALHLA